MHTTMPLRSPEVPAAWREVERAAACPARCQHQFRRHRGARRRLVRFVGGPHPRTDRPQRRRQDHAVQLRLASLYAEPRRPFISKVKTSSTNRPTKSPGSASLARFRISLCSAPCRVLDNVRVGGHSQSRSDFFSDCAASALGAARGKHAQPRTPGILIDYLELRDVAHRCVADLPFGTQKRVELARALAARPKLLLLDEPAGGLNHREVGRTWPSDPPHPRRAPESPCCSSSIT